MPAEKNAMVNQYIKLSKGFTFVLLAFMRCKLSFFNLSIYNKFLPPNHYAGCRGDAWKRNSSKKFQKGIEYPTLPDLKATIMKTMTCKQLGGACNQTFSANSFDEIAMLVSHHAREMVQAGDAAHLEAMNEMRKQMSSPEAMATWMNEKRDAFNALPEDKA
jgi:predicted small metal-binding protein